MRLANRHLGGEVERAPKAKGGRRKLFSDRVKIKQVGMPPAARMVRQDGARTGTGAREKDVSVRDVF
jgi:hypothetical protein